MGRGGIAAYAVALLECACLSALCPPCLAPEPRPSPGLAALRNLPGGLRRRAGRAPAAAFERAHHWALWVEKRGLSTAAVAASLARWAGCAPGAVGCGAEGSLRGNGPVVYGPPGVAGREPSLPEGKGWRATALPAAKKWRRGITGNGFRLRLAGAPRRRRSGRRFPRSWRALHPHRQLLAPSAPERGRQSRRRAALAGRRFPGCASGFLFSAARAISSIACWRLVSRALASPPTLTIFTTRAVSPAPLWGRGRSASRARWPA